MPSHDTDFYFDLRDEADRQAQIAAKAIPEPRDRSATDPDGIVTVQLGADGTVRDIRLGMDWQQHAEPEEVAPAIMAAISAINGQVAAEWNQLLSDAQDGPRPSTRPLPQWIADEAESLPSDATLTPESVLVQLMSLFDEMESQLDAAIADGEALLDHTETARSARGEVEVTVGTNGSIQDLRLDPRWVKSAHPNNIGRLVLETLQSAQRRSVAAFAEFKERSEATTSALGKFQNSRQLANRIGLL